MSTPSGAHSGLSIEIPYLPYTDSAIATRDGASRIVNGVTDIGATID